MDISNEELFNSALSDEAPAGTEEVVTEGEGQPNRDEMGRFAAKSEEPEAKPEAEKPAVEQPVESVGLRQLREAFERQQQRSAQLERELQALRPKPEPIAKPDIFEKPDEFVRTNVQEMVTPIEQRLSTTVESWSRKFAIKEHGEEAVASAYKALDQAASAGDPQAIAVVNAVKQSMDPYGDMVSWYRGNEASRDPDAFFQRRLDEALKDDKFKAGLMAKLQPAAEEKPRNEINLPPSLSRVASAAAALSEGGDLSNESLFAHAMR